MLGFLSLSFKNDSKKIATKVIQGTAKLLNLDQQWVILGERGVSAPVLQNNGSQYYQLYHPGTPDESISVRNIVNSSVQ